MIINEDFSLAEAAHLSGCGTERIKKWCHMDLPTGPGGSITGGVAQGRKRRFNFFAVMEFATVARIMAVGFQLDARRAFTIASSFAHSGSRKGPDVAPRLPGLPFEHHHTLIVASPSEHGIYHWGPDLERKGDLIADAGLHRDPSVVVSMRPVFGRMCHELDLDPCDELRRAYDAVYPEPPDLESVE